MLYAQDSRKFIACMEPNARMRLVFKALYKKYNGGLRAMKYSKVKSTIQDFGCMYPKMCHKEELQINGAPRQFMDELLKEVGI